MISGNKIKADWNPECTEFTVLISNCKLNSSFKLFISPACLLITKICFLSVFIPQKIINTQKLLPKEIIETGDLGTTFLTRGQRHKKIIKWGYLLNSGKNRKNLKVGFFIFFSGGLEKILGNIKYRGNYPYFLKKKVILS
jgi:hypothetical protein